eukprot:scaffold87106_cov73-Attheya_sp.AAC.2
MSRIAKFFGRKFAPFNNSSFSWIFRKRCFNLLSSTAALHKNRIAARPSLMTEVCSVPLNVTLFVSDATRCPQRIVDARKFPPALLVGFGMAIPAACLTDGRRGKRSRNGCPTLLYLRRAGRKSSFKDDSTA